MPEALAGRVVLITGAGRGIGRALALGFATAGAEVIGVARTGADLEAVSDTIRTSGGQAHTMTVDVSSEADVQRLQRWIRDRFGRLDVLVNNAALRMIHVGDPHRYTKPLLDLRVEDWDRMLAVNLRGPFLMCRILGELLQAPGRASMINVSAGAGVRGQAGRTPYSVSKFGLEGLTQCLAAEWHELNIAVNSLSPGVSVFTDALKLEPDQRGPDRPYARPELLVPPAVFLAQQDARSLTGARIEAFAWVQEHGLGGWERWAADTV